LYSKVRKVARSSTIVGRALACISTMPDVVALTPYLADIGKEPFAIIGKVGLELDAGRIVCLDVVGFRRRYSHHP
jgi:hypothetical protein